MFSKRLTPKLVSLSDTVYYIPIYQRLFEWEETQITQLLEDLYQSFSKDERSPYYIGMLTSNKGNDLIDGQQRFTVMMLLGLELSHYDESWNKFLKTSDGGLRLKFRARPDDYNYLINSCMPVEGYENSYMKRGLECISKFIKATFDDKNKKSAYSRYVFENMSFFISYLPNDYSGRSLNKYFETMNSTGKNLENHEILKVKMLQQVLRHDKVRMTRIWNAVSDMDRKLIRRRDKERDDQLFGRFDAAYKAVARDDLDRLFSKGDVNDLTNDTSEIENALPIGDIAANSEKPTQQRLGRNTGFRSILSFSEFLLQVLWLVLDERGREEVSDDYGVVRFFDVNRLQETFSHFKVNADDFIMALLRYRLLYDRYVVSISNEDNTYELDLPDDEKEEDASGNSYYDLLLMYESMLYVNSSAMTYYLWLRDLLKYADETHPGCKDLYDLLKQKDEERHPSVDITPESLTYYNADRYWFWKLDFYIWQHRGIIFKEDKGAQSVADRYVFRRNRSIEHIAPQTPEDGSTLKLDDETRNCFGNLVMISSSQNSSLSNSSFEIKRAKVLAYIKGDLSGTIESLKMLLIYQNEEWNGERITKHEEECIKVLKGEYLTRIGEQ